MASTSSVLRFSPETIGQNNYHISKLRTLFCITSGIICGILGLTSLKGLMFFLIASIISDIVIMSKMQFKLNNMLNTNILYFCLDGFTFTSMTFVVFWIMSFTIVHIY